MPDGCPVCGSPGPRPFFHAGDLPVHSTLLMPSRDEALAFPRRPLELACCPHCGFVYNHLFDPAVHRYSARCEESQAASPTFSQWLDGLIERLVSRHGVRDKRVLEIGCGKGEFLARLCAAGNNDGIGYDPAFVPGRMAGGAGRSLEMHTQLWTKACGIHNADVVACRHTLEHIAPVGAFLSDLREAIDDRDTLVFFDLPDTARILREGAFWDIYYEHCSYFTAASLHAAFAQAGFEVLEQWPDYAGQFLLLLARPAQTPQPAPAADIAPQVAAFEQAVARQMRHWQAFFAATEAAGERVVAWGGGSKASAFLSQVAGAGCIEQVVDINPNKQGFFVPGAGQQVVAPGALRVTRPQHVVLMNPVYREEVEAMLRDLAVPAAVHSLEALDDDR